MHSWSIAPMRQAAGRVNEASRWRSARRTMEGRLMDHRFSSCRARWARTCFAAVGVALLGSTPAANARVTQMIITTVESPTFGGASFGSVGQYERIQGKIIGEVDPGNPQNAVIVDIENAPKNPNGTVSYSSDFQIIRPINFAQGNHRVVFDLPNRGSARALSTLNNASGNSLASSGTLGNGFLMNLGYTIVEGAWDITVAQGGSAFGVSFPLAKKPDGSSITGVALEEFVIDFN